MSTTTEYRHILVDGEGAAHIGKTRYKVIHLASEHYHYGWTAEELLRQHTDLRPEEVYAALTYFYDHFDELTAEMVRNEKEAGTHRRNHTLSRAELLARVKE